MINVALGRILTAVVMGILTMLALWVEQRMNITIDRGDLPLIAGAIVTVVLALAAVLGKKLTAMTGNVGDAASSTLAAYQGAKVEQIKRLAVAESATSENVASVHGKQSVITDEKSLTAPIVPKAAMRPYP